MSFISLAQAALDPIYVTLGEAMTWDGQGPFQVILDTRQADINFGHSKARLNLVTLSVRKSDVAQPAPRQVVTFGSRTFTLLADAEPQLDAQGLEWTCEAKES